MAVERSLKTRPIAIRNHCLSQLAADAGLPVPDDAETASLCPELSLEETWSRWQAAHMPSTAVVRPLAPANLKKPRRRWRSATVELPVLIAVSVVLAALVARPRAPVVELENPVPVAAAAAWTSVTDSVRAEVPAKIVAMSRSGVALSTTLSATELTALTFTRSQPRQLARLDSLESRIDTLWWVRGRMDGGSRFEIGGRVYLAQRRRAELRLSRLVINGTVVPAPDADLLLARIQGRSAPPRSGRAWFEMPEVVANLRMGQGGALLRTRPRMTP